MFKWLKLNYSIVNADVQSMIFKCNCGNPLRLGNRVVLKGIDMKRSELDGIVKMIDNQIDLGLKAIKDYQENQRETNDQYDDRGDWDNLILNALEHIIEQQKSRRELIKENI